MLECECPRISESSRLEKTSEVIEANQGRAVPWKSHTCCPAAQAQGLAGDTAQIW